MTDGWQKLLNQSGYELNLVDTTNYNKMVKKRKMEKEKKKYKYKGFAFDRDGYDKFNTKLNECLKLYSYLSFFFIMLMRMIKVN